MLLLSLAISCVYISDKDFDLEPQEFIFLIDRSASMYWGSGDTAIKMAKEALITFIHSLP